MNYIIADLVVRAVDAVVRGEGTMQNWQHGKTNRKAPRTKKRGC